MPAAPALPLQCSITAPRNSETREPGTTGISPGRPAPLTRHLARPQTGSHDRGATQEIAPEQRKHRPSRYFSSCLAMTTRRIWLVPS